MQVFDLLVDEAAELVEGLGRLRLRLAVRLHALHADGELAAHVLVDEAGRWRRRCCCSARLYKTSLFSSFALAISVRYFEQVGNYKYTYVAYIYTKFRNLLEQS